MDIIIGIKSAGDLIPGILHLFIRDEYRIPAVHFLLPVARERLLQRGRHAEGEEAEAREAEEAEEGEAAEEGEGAEGEEGEGQEGQERQGQGRKG